MPNIKSSERSVKTDAERRARNYSVRSAIKTSTRKVEEAVHAGKADEAKNLLINAASIIDKAAAKGVIHKNAAARKKSRLAHKANTAQQA
ncbi:30S ribosomal protein S20 [Sporomusa acidovorans]|uniref:Small ribosomal subunit protein bS20 n=1 Tax=Sporomusa acidovorans (strain ATCC 49682 / DSM 3132 / Mol) TaxID=1123286 RepID=A0ABZ3J4I9_SPOA4|nr:30S ribosomal protein S20 [Sporomusa acidovorans]OZC23103.1 30S ribosomal protein S20 [Sporomusa acidovorans DSM 3132]SDF05597.1 small subunit ribosomal protein S20 [Sporomusa acidovorans]